MAKPSPGMERPESIPRSADVDGAAGKGQAGRSSSGLERRPRNSRLADDAQERARLQLAVLRDWHADRRAGKLLLHDNVTPALSGPHEAVRFQDPTDLATRESPKARQP